MLGKLRKINPGTTVRLEVDRRGRFLRCFLAFEMAMRSQLILIPLLGFDGSHSRHPKYNGVVLSLIGRYGNGQNITLATALVNIENESKVVVFWTLWSLVFQ